MSVSLLAAGGIEEDDSMEMSVSDESISDDSIEFEEMDCEVMIWQGNKEIQRKKVQFSNLVVVHEFIDNSEVMKTREVYWEVFARDRSRFKDRISQVEGVLSAVLNSEHRTKVYDQLVSPARKEDTAEILTNNNNNNISSSSCDMLK